MFEVPHHPLWNWAVDLILDLCLAPHFEWDVWKIFKHDRGEITHVYTEPWTAGVFWDFQVCFSLFILFL
jgi:hypothetical protein